MAASITNYWFWFVITVTDENTYILTTDADVRFTHESVEALLDLMARDPTVGAVCGRTHPLGVGPIVWYQVFDYAIGHWFQKVHRNYMIVHMFHLKVLSYTLAFPVGRLIKSNHF